MVTHDRRDTTVNRGTARAKLQPAHRHTEGEVSYCTQGNWTRHFLFFRVVLKDVIMNEKTSARVL